MDPSKAALPHSHQSNTADANDGDTQTVLLQQTIIPPSAPKDVSHQNVKNIKSNKCYFNCQIDPLHSELHIINRPVYKASA